MNTTATLTALIAETEFEGFSAAAVTHAKRSIRDFTGVAVYGSHHEVGRTMMSYVNKRSAVGESIVMGHGTYDAPDAALANGTFGHAIDYDDTFESTVLHPSASVFPAALAVAAESKTTGTEILTGYIVGLEVAFRIARSLEPAHWEAGWHSTGTVGTFGATAGAGSVLDLSRTELEHAFGIAASSAAGLRQNSRTMTKPFHAGHAAQSGVRAALMAENGYTADRRILDGDRGFGTLYTVGQEFHPERITEPELDDWAVLDNGFKPYPSGVVTAAPMEALRQIMVEHDLYNEEIETVTLAVDERFDRLVDPDPEDATAARFSYQFCLAAILRERHGGIHQFTDEFVTEPETRDAIHKVDVNLVDGLFSGDDLAEASYGASVTLTTTDGVTFSNTVRDAPGSPSNPLSDERLRAKFDECVETVYDADTTDRIWEILGRLETIDGLKDLEAVLT